MDRKQTILIVDDEPGNRQLLQRIFERDYQVIYAEDGASALNQLEVTTPDIVLLDIMLPDVNGLDVLKTIRAKPEIEDLPVILLSALQRDADIVQGLQLGANDYITKPFNVAVVQARIKTQAKLKQLADAHKQTIQRLQAANQTQERFMRIASHDLKNPLSNLQTVFFLIRDMVDETPQMIELLDVADGSIKLMLNIIEQFLETTVLHDSRVELNMQPLNIAELVLRVLAHHQAAARAKEIHVSLEDVTAWIMGDVHRMEQVIGNLISNAIKYSPPGSEVRLYAEERDDRVCLYVADQGPGVPPDERDQLFQAFSKLTPRPTGGEKSIGLGLWIVRQLVVLQGGEVQANFPASGGSVFVVCLAAAPDDG